MKFSLFLLFCCGFFFHLNGQDAKATQERTLDRILAVVDNDIVLQSDIDNQFTYAIHNGQKDDGTLRCSIFEQMLTQKLLLSKARLDSLKISPEEVEGELSRRVDYMTRQMGSVAELEKAYKKSIIEIKVELRPSIKEQLLVEQQRSKIFKDVNITPREVKAFFNKINKDSLPYLPAEVEVSRIVIKAVASKASKDSTRLKLEQIRKQILNGEISFEQAAHYYSNDVASAQQDGDLGEFGRGVMDPAFEETAYTMSEGEISPVFESQFGFHIIKLKKKLGDRVVASHILLIPKISPDDQLIAKAKLTALRRKIMADSITFERAAGESSQDRRTKDNGGIVTTQQNDYEIPLDQLESNLYFTIDSMKVGQISAPAPFLSKDDPTLQNSFQIVKLIARVPPHQANLDQDYQKFQSAALQAKQSLELEKWFTKARQQVFVEIKANDCSQALQHWQ